ncbi:hypothetical protein HYV74_03060 [Candidatus Uhrbacteria bacterium]|nr:hypothetical protein [Candidatus Uhrbacteria bacterium]
MMADRRASDALRHRILSAFPAGHYALDTFLRLTDVVESWTVPSAAVECLSAPKLLLNPDFIAAYCKTDEHLFMLVMHELHHVLLGHTRLFPRMTPVDNIVFDAIINAILARLFPEPIYTSFLTQFSAADQFPAALLRPPPGWPKKIQIPKTLPRPVQHMIRTLYSEASGTYDEVYRLFQEDPQLRECIGKEARMPVLLGDHSPEDTEGRGESASHHPLLNGMVRSIVEKWPMPPDPIRGRSVGGDIRDILLERTPVPLSAQQVLRRMLRTMAEAQVKGAVTHRHRACTDRSIEAPIPTLRDRRALVASAGGWSPLIFRNVIPAQQITDARGITSIYIDVSGSTRPYWNLFAGLVHPYVQQRRARLFAFSEQIHEMTTAQLAAGTCASTSGTDAVCIWEHALQEGFQKILIMTDGYVGPPTREWRARLITAKLRIRVALTPNGYLPDLQPIAEELTELPLLAP